MDRIVGKSVCATLFASAKTTQPIINTEIEREINIIRNAIAVKRSEREKAVLIPKRLEMRATKNVWDIRPIMPNKVNK